MTKLADLHALARIDRHHGSLKELTARWIARNNATILVEKDGDKPLIAAVVRRAVCPIDPTGTFQVEFWIVDTTESPERIHDAMAASARSILVEMAKAGDTTCWAFVPFKGRHLAAFLDRMVEASAGRWETADAMDIDEDGIRHANELGRFFIAYFGKTQRFVR